MIFNGKFPKIRASLLIALAECAVLCHWLNYHVYMYVNYRYVKGYGSMGTAGTAMAELVSCIFICFILYLFLYFMYASKPETFIYSIGFLSCCHLFSFVFVFCFGSEASHDLPSYIVFVDTLLFVLVFYSYAALCECNGRPDAVTILFLAVTGTLFTGLSLSELLYYSFPTVTLCLPFFGTYFICCLILKKAILSIRIFSWSMFCLSLVMYLIFVLYVMFVPAWR